MNVLDDANLSRVHALSWLRPAREISRAWVEERFAKHLEALAPGTFMVPPVGNPPPPIL